jgi:hypothetical protein
LLAAAPALAAEPVTVDNFARAETHGYMQARVDAGCFGKLCHERQPRPADQQEIVRLQRDTLYSSGVFDLESPLTVTLPEPGGRFQSLLLINENHHVPLVAYGPASITLTREKVGSRYVYLAFRTFMDPNDAKDVARSHALQDQLGVSQAMPGRFEAPQWDTASREQLRKELMDLSRWNPNPVGRFGAADKVDQVRHLIGTASGWGGNPPEAAIYVNRFVANNDGTGAYTLTLRDVPVDAFWSVTIYNGKGYYEAPEANASVNSVTARKAADGSAVVHMGGDPKAANFLRIMPGWNYVIRLYRPRGEILDGRWTVPDAVPVSK